MLIDSILTDAVSELLERAGCVRTREEIEAAILRRLIMLPRGLREACVPNRLGKGHHDDKTGHPCGPEKGAKSVRSEPGRKEPGEKKFKKQKSIRGEMVSARRIGKGEESRVVLADGSPAPEHIRPSMIPPGWTDVTVGTDPDADVLVTARDEKGRLKTVYRDDFEMRNAALKFARIDEMMSKRKEIDAEIQEHRQSKDPTMRDAADCAWLMSVQATRPGSESDTGAEVKAYGATTLEGRHVVKTKDGVRLQFIGKEGVAHDHLISDPRLAEMLLERSRKAGPDGKLFDIDERQVNQFIGELDGGEFTAKDFRTRRANELALQAIAEYKGPPRDQKEYKARVKEVAEKVSHVLGNRPAQALASYINPAVFSAWRFQ